MAQRTAEPCPVETGVPQNGSGRGYGAEATGGEEEEEDPVEQGREKAGLENPARKVEGRREREKQARGSLEE